ncbi:hypothetical protein ETAA8_11360 [Anatilimnocola aggregata]|uniref:Uncharacterized protein n=1 Tax=Anatilimnocola aggregata TaxID=2528021 RepID=A0A517Y754_9BACT|nr:hypothetical protein [Anatilimnocola aggregata]QDU26064.1 hypothetical protein ETAA8_11360 [Anatilimnocola aggregata]
MTDQPRQPPTLNNPQPSPGKLKALRMGCVFAWLLLFTPLSLVIALRATCGTFVAGQSPGTVLILLMVAGIFMILGTFLVFLPAEPPQP